MSETDKKNQSCWPETEDVGGQPLKDPVTLSKISEHVNEPMAAVLQGAEPKKTEHCMFCGESLKYFDKTDVNGIHCFCFIYNWEYVV